MLSCATFPLMFAFFGGETWIPGIGSLKMNIQQSLEMCFPFFNLKRVHQASEHAVSEAFSLEKSSYPQGPCGPVTRLETMEQLQDHDDAYEEGELRHCLHKLHKMNCS